MRRKKSCLVTNLIFCLSSCFMNWIQRCKREQCFIFHGNLISYNVQTLISVAFCDFYYVLKFKFNILTVLNYQLTHLQIYKSRLAPRIFVTSLEHDNFVGLMKRSHDLYQLFPLGKSGAHFLNSCVCTMQRADF